MALDIRFDENICSQKIDKVQFLIRGGIRITLTDESSRRALLQSNKQIFSHPSRRMKYFQLTGRLFLVYNCVTNKVQDGGSGES